MKKNRTRSVKIPNAERLKNIALHYLSRYAASEASLRRVLQNRLRRASMVHASFAADHALQETLRQTIESIIAAHKKSGAINDESFADMKVASLRRSGKSMRAIQQKLAARGLAKNTVSRALHEHDVGADEDAEFAAARTICKKRRAGPYRPVARRKEGDDRKDFAMLARAGFQAAIIRKILGYIPEDFSDD